MTSYLEESPGVESLMRVLSNRMFWVATIYLFCILGLYGHAYVLDTIGGKTAPVFDPTLVWLCLVLYSLAFFPKVAQKLIEAKFGVKLNGADTTSDKP